MQEDILADKSLRGTSFISESSLISIHHGGTEYRHQAQYSHKRLKICVQQIKVMTELVTNHYVD